MRLPVLLLTTLLALSGYPRDTLSHSTARRHTIGRIENVEISTASQRVEASSSFDITFSISDRVGERVKLALAPNEDVISDSAFIQIIGPDGKPRGAGEAVRKEDHRVFRGNAFIQDARSRLWRDAGWARIMIYRDGEVPLFEGAFSLDGDHHHIQKNSHHQRTRQGGYVEPAAASPLDRKEEKDFMVVWRDSDNRDFDDDSDSGDGSGHSIELKRDSGSASGSTQCGVDTLHLRAYPGSTRRGFSAGDEVLARLTRRQSAIDTIGSTAGCPTTRRVALVGIATDCTYTSSFGSVADVKTNVINQINTASALYERTFNISLAVRNLTVTEAACPSAITADNAWNQPCSANIAIGTRLSQFSLWRGQQRDGNAFWTLMSTCTTGSAVGIAWLGAACMQNSRTDRGRSTIAGANYVAKTTNEWQVLAHEIGHTFGAQHDCTADTCRTNVGASGRTEDCCPLSRDTCDAGGRFLMNPSARGGNTQFSQCSIGSVCSQIGSGTVVTKCLVDNRNVQSAEGAVCGNGVVEAGEECDSKNPCCNQATCRYATGAVCDPSSDGCCTRQCRVASSGTVCRPSMGTCDPVETCDGTSAICPADVNNTPQNGATTCTTANDNSSSNGGTTNGAVDWFTQNRTVIIGVASGVGGLIVLLILGGIVNSCRRRRRIKRQQRQMIAATAAASSVAAAGIGGRFSAAHYPVRGAGGGRPSPPLSPSYYSPPGQDGPGPTWPPPVRTMSARYA